MLLSMLLVALLGQPALEPIAAAAAAPTRPTIEISLADTLRALPAGAATANGSLLSDDGSSGGDTPILPGLSDRPAAALSATTAFASQSSAELAERRANANRARAPPAA